MQVRGHPEDRILQGHRMGQQFAVRLVLHVLIISVTLPYSINGHTAPTIIFDKFERIKSSGWAYASSNLNSCWAPLLI